MVAARAIKVGSCDLAGEGVRVAAVAGESARGVAGMGGRVRGVAGAAGTTAGAGTGPGRLGVAGVATSSARCFWAFLRASLIRLIAGLARLIS